jgi:hypothetical protein
MEFRTSNLQRRCRVRSPNPECVFECVLDLLRGETLLRSEVETTAIPVPNRVAEHRDLVEDVTKFSSS